MVNYDKWDKIDDSEDEDQSGTAAGRARAAYENDGRERRLCLQEEIAEWLRRQMHLLRKEETEPQHQGSGFHRSSMNRHDHAGSMPRGGGYSGLPSDFERSKPLMPYRKLTGEEKRVVAMLIAVSAFGEGETNLTRHPELLDLVRHNRWLEEDPGTLELMCRIHNAQMRRSGDRDRGQPQESEEDWRMRNRLLCGINTLAAPKRAKCEGGLLDMMTQICTPETEAAREMRRKWQTKEYAKDALFASLFPDACRDADEESSDSGMWEIWLLAGLIVLIILGILALVYYVAPLSRGAGKVAKNATAIAAKAAAAASKDPADAGKSEL